MAARARALVRSLALESISSLKAKQTITLEKVCPAERLQSPRARALRGAAMCSPETLFCMEQLPDNFLSQGVPANASEFATVALSPWPKALASTAANT